VTWKDDPVEQCAEANDNENDANHLYKEPEAKTKVFVIWVIL
jgi:hypothetical protein